MTDPSVPHEELLQRRPIIITGLRRITKLISKAERNPVKSSTQCSCRCSSQGSTDIREWSFPALQRSLRPRAPLASSSASFQSIWSYQYTPSTVNKTQTKRPHFWGMDSYTLFGHIVGIVGVNQCMQAHIELSGLGVLPETA